MTKKKSKPSEQVWTYKVKVVPVRSPTKWTAGEWEKDKEALGGYRFTGEPQQELLGYQPVMMAYCNDELIGICESIPNGFNTAAHIHETEQAAWDYLEEYKKHSKKSVEVGNTFVPFVNSYLPGEVVE